MEDAKGAANSVTLHIKRVYAPPAGSDGLRVLVDRLWPRGLSKDKARVDIWMKEIAPSDSLRRRFHGHPEQWHAFRAAYAHELAQEPASATVKILLEKLGASPVTLLYASRNQERNNAIALKEFLLRGFGGK